MNTRSKVVWKYRLEVVGEQVIALPRRGVVMQVGMQGDAICLWLLTEPEAEPVDVTIYVAGTGHPVGDAWRPLGTVFQDRLGLVWHVFCDGWGASPDGPPIRMLKGGL
jgi:hypothetical protein